MHERRSLFFRARVYVRECLNARTHLYTHTRTHSRTHQRTFICGECRRSLIANARDQYNTFTNGTRKNGIDCARAPAALRDRTLSPLAVRRSSLSTQAAGEAPRMQVESGLAQQLVRMGRSANVHSGWPTSRLHAPPRAYAARSNKNT